MKRPIATPFAAAALLALGGLSASCAGQSSIDILRVSDLGPRQAEIGDRLEVTGQHFPQSSELKRVRLTLRATLARAGQPACASPVEVTITDPPEGASEFDSLTRQMRDATYAHSAQRTLRLDGPDRVAFVLDEELYRNLTRCPGERSSAPVDHATLSFGNAHARYARLGVTVHFEGITGTQAIEGTLRGATLDVLAPPSRRVVHVDALRRRTQRVLDALGVTLADAHPSTGGLRIASVRNGGAAQRAGIGANDVLHTVDGLTVLALEDLAVPENTRAVRLGVARDDIIDERVVTLDGFATASPRDLLAACIAMLVAAIAIALALRPATGVVPSLVRVAQRALGSEERGAFAPWWLSKARDAMRGRAGRDPIPYLALAAPISAIALAPLAPTLLRLGWDVGLLYALGAGLRLLSGPSLSLRTMTRVIPVSMAAILALGTSVIASGTFRAEGVVAAQGAAPWSWHAFRSPAATALAVLFMVALYAGAPEHHKRKPGASAESGGRAQFIREIAGWIGTFFVSAAGVTSLFGGWQVPGTDLGQQEASAALQMAGAVSFFLKTWALTLATAWLRSTASASRGSALIHRAGRTISLTAMLAAIAHAACALLTPALPPFVATTIAHGTFALVLVALVSAMARAKAQRAWGLTSYVPPVFSKADDTVMQ